VIHLSYLFFPNTGTLMTDPSLNNIKVNVQTRYIEDQSNPDKNYYIFAYTITIVNEGQQPAQLLTRHWVITDSNHKVQEVRGDGVIGEQPILKPGEQFVYTSGTMLETSVGTMKGSYQMEADDGFKFDATIEEFVLSTPRVLH
jgi:ApaG protein